MRLFLTYAALALSAPTWSAGPLEPQAPPESARESATPAKITRPVNPDKYYPANSIRGGETGAPIVQVCVDAAGKLLRAPVVTQASGFPNLDAAAVRVARDVGYAAGMENGRALPESCLNFKVKFLLGADAGIARPVNPDDYYPAASRARNEQGGPLVKVCVDPNGQPLREPEITESSGFPDLDAAAVKVAKAVQYRAGTINDNPVLESCIRYKILFGKKATDGS